MPIPEFRSNLLTGTLAVCAVIVTAAVARREFFPAPIVDPQLAAARPRHVDGAERLANQGHVLGEPTAPIKLVEFSDFQCPYCKQFYAAVEELQRRHPGKVALVYRHFPLRIHPLALPAAVASECAALQGRFESYYSLLFEHQDSIGTTSWQTFASRAGVPNLGAFELCRTTDAAKARVEADIRAAATIGTTGTPTLVLRDEVLGMALPVDSLEKWISRFVDLRTHPLP